MAKPWLQLEIRAYQLGLSFLMMIWFACLAIVCAEADTVPPVAVNSFFPSIGGIKKVFATDFACALSYQKKRVFWDNAEQEIWMNLDGEDVQLVRVQTSPKVTFNQYKTKDITINIDFGPSEEAFPPGPTAVEGTIYKNVKMTLLRGKRSFKINLVGGCDGGLGYGL